MRAILPYVMLAALMLCLLPLGAQQPPDTSSDLVSMDKEMLFPEAMSILQYYFVKYEGKIIVDLSGVKTPIGLPINKIHWKAAFLSILASNMLTSEESANAYVIYPPGEGGGGGGQASPIESRPAEQADEVLIEVTFFEVDQSVLNEIGVDWSTLMNGNVDFSADMTGASNVTEDVLSLSFNQSFDAGSGTIDLNTLLKTLEAHDKGHIISRPQITVISGEEGYVHDGMDFSVKQVDDAGNTSDKFFSAGTIVTVTPTVLTDTSGMKYVKLEVEAERSSATPGSVSTVVTISKASTQKLLFNGEEAVIGGLTSKEVTNARSGIPFLKDLTWWFFGIRYLTGYESHKTVTKELLVIIRASILPSMYERMDNQNLQQDVETIRHQLPRLEDQLLNGDSDKKE